MTNISITKFVFRNLSMASIIVANANFLIRLKIKDFVNENDPKAVVMKTFFLIKLKAQKLKFES